MKPRIKVGTMWRHKVDNYYVRIVRRPPGSAPGTVAHEVHGGVKLYHEPDFRDKFEPLI